MKSTFAVGITLIALLALPAPAQMMHGGGDMGGGRRTMVNLVSPTDSPLQVRRGVLMIGQHMSMMQVRPPAGQSSPSRVWLLLRLYGVSDGLQKRSTAPTVGRFAVMSLASLRYRTSTLPR